MTIRGPGPFDCEAGQGMIGHIIAYTAKHLEKLLDGLETHESVERGIVAGIVTLRILTETCPLAGKIQILPQQFESWKQRYFDWFDSVEEQLPKKFVKEMRRVAEKEFDSLWKLIDCSE